MTDELRNKLIKTARQMNVSDLNVGTSGNLSVRYGEGMLITPSGVAYADMLPEDIVYMHPGGVVDGRHKPSSEWRFHAAIYQHRADAGAVLHAHPVKSTALACLSKGIPAFHYMVAVAGGKDIRCAEYATFGTPELSQHVLNALQDRKACLMAHHGLTCLSGKLDMVLALAIEVEQLAAMYCQTLTLGAADILSDQEMSKVLEKFKHYGLQNTPVKTP